MKVVIELRRLDWKSRPFSARVDGLGGNLLSGRRITREQNARLEAEKQLRMRFRGVGLEFEIEWRVA